MHVFICVSLSVHMNCATFYRKPTYPFINLPCYISQYLTYCDLPRRFLHAVDLRVICAQYNSPVFLLINERLLWHCHAIT